MTTPPPTAQTPTNREIAESVADKLNAERVGSYAAWGHDPERGKLWRAALVEGIEAALAAKDRDARQIAERVREAIAVHFEYLGSPGIADIIKTIRLTPLLGEASGEKDGERHREG